MAGSRPTSQSKEYGRRQYVDYTEDPYMSDMKKVTDFEMYALNLFPEKHSEYKKPYMEDDYLEMEYAYSPPAFLSPKSWLSPLDFALGGGGSSYFLSWGVPLATASGVDEDLVLGSIVSYCILVCHPPSKCDDDIECLTSISSGYDQAGKKIGKVDAPKK